jgi:hypothetical protein
VTRKRHRSALGVAIALAAWFPLASETQTVEVTAEVFGLARTPEQARQEALQRARDEAVARVAGISIAAQQLRLKSERPGTIRDAFSYLVHTSTHGRIVKEEVTYTTRLQDEIPVYRATLRAEVVLEQGTRDPGFELELETRPASHTYRDGETIAIEIVSSRDCYLTVLNLRSDGSIRFLLPNPYEGANHASSGERYRLPGQSDGFEIHVQLSPDRRREREQLLVVATLDPVPFVMRENVGAEVVPEIERDLTLTLLNQWLVRIPVERRAEALWDFEVVK